MYLLNDHESPCELKIKIFTYKSVYPKHYIYSVNLISHKHTVEVPQKGNKKYISKTLQNSSILLLLQRASKTINRFVLFLYMIR